MSVSSTNSCPALLKAIADGSRSPRMTPTSVVAAVVRSIVKIRLPMSSSNMPYSVPLGSKAILCIKIPVALTLSMLPIVEKEPSARLSNPMCMAGRFGLPPAAG